jgi:hypothetical protein
MSIPSRPNPTTKSHTQPGNHRSACQFTCNGRQVQSQDLVPTATSDRANGSPPAGLLAVRFAITTGLDGAPCPIQILSLVAGSHALPNGRNAGFELPEHETAMTPWNMKSRTCSSTGGATRAKPSRNLGRMEKHRI